jgi:hypothetical protein
VRLKIEEEQRYATRVSLERDLLWLELSDELDVAVDPTEISLHDSWNNKKMGGIQGGFDPSERSRSKSLSGRRGRDRPDAVPFKHVAAGPNIKVSKAPDLGQLGDPDLIIGPLDERVIKLKGLEELGNRELVGDLEDSVPHTTTQTIGSLVDENLTGDVDDFEVATVQYFKALQLPDQGAEPGGSRGAFLNHIVGYHVIGKIENFVTSKTGVGNRLLAKNLNQSAKFLPVGGFTSSGNSPSAHP